MKSQAASPAWARRREALLLRLGDLVVSIRASPVRARRLVVLLGALRK